MNARMPFGVMNIERDLDWLCPGGRLRRGCVRGAQVVSRSEGVRLWRVEGGARRISAENWTANGATKILSVHAEK